MPGSSDKTWNDTLASQKDFAGKVAEARKDGKDAS